MSDYRDKPVTITMTFDEWDRVRGALYMPNLKDVEAKIGEALLKAYRLREAP